MAATKGALTLTLNSVPSGGARNQQGASRSIFMNLLFCGRTKIQ